MKLRVIPFFCLSLCSAMSGRGQLIITTADLPSQVGQYSRAYYSTNNTSVTNMLALINGTNGIPSPVPGQTNYPQSWNFATPQQSHEIVLRTDIIAASNGPGGEEFPAATYAEQDTFEPSSQIAWRYYSLTNTGRLYHGFYNPLDQNADYLVPFDSPTVDLPASIQYGQTWTRTVTWHGLVLGIFPVNYSFATTALVDATGTLSLPGIGAVPAMRVHEVHRYQASSPDWGLLDSHTNHHYYWLSPGLGVTVQVFQFGNNSVFPMTLPHTNLVLRMFQASFYSNSVTAGPSGNLRIHLQGGAALLDWDAFTNSSYYRVEAASSMVNPNWQSLGLSTNRSWSDTLTSTQRFFRVVGLP